jgi:hypothetical protein
LQLLWYLGCLGKWVLIQNNYIKVHLIVSLLGGSKQSSAEAQMLEEEQI